MIQAIYDCKYDGNKCPIVPKFDEKGFLIPESNEKLKSEYGKIFAKECIENSWDACMKCDRNFTISGTCRGMLKLKEIR